MIGLIVTFFIVIPAASWLARRAKAALEWSKMRSNLLKEARAEGIDGEWQRASLDLIDWSLLYTAKNISLVARRGDRTIRMTPMSLGWRREDPPWTWWQITVEPVASKQHFSFHVKKRREDMYRHPKHRDCFTGDEAFDAELCAYTFEQDDPDANQRSMSTAHRVLARPEARELLRELIVGNTDSAGISAGGLRISRQRNGLAIAEVLAVIDQVTRLADIVEEAIAHRLYR